MFGRRKAAPRRRAEDQANQPNGPKTPTLSADAMRRAMNHAAWRDPHVERRRHADLRAAVRTLERTAACLDQAADRLAEASDSIVKGRESHSVVMRGLLTARIEEVLDSLERVAAMAQDGAVNLLCRDAQGLHLTLQGGGFRYALNPVDVRRGPAGLDIPHLTAAFEDPEETAAIELALTRASRRVSQFCDRLTHDAAMLAGLLRAIQPADESFDDVPDPPPPAPLETRAEPAELPLPPPSLEHFSDVPEPDWLTLGQASDADRNGKAA